MLYGSTMQLQANLGHFVSRKLLLHSPVYQQAVTTTGGVERTVASPAPSPYGGNKSFDANVVMVLSVLLCALICSLGLNSIVRCALRCSSLVRSESFTSQENTVARLANTGIKKKALKTFPTVSYWEGLKLPGLDKECVICLSEFVSGELVKILPKCNHGFHARCIDKWLSSHSSCPTCRHSLTETCRKIISGGACSSTTSSQSQFQVQNLSSIDIVSIRPLQREQFVPSYEV